MCLILVAWRCDPKFPLVVAANRDEFHQRRSAQAAFWAENPSVLAGRDLVGQGTWLGVTRTRRFAAVTNYRGGTDPGARESRGWLARRFLENDTPPGDFVSRLAERCAEYSGFNLLAADAGELWWISNRGGEARRLEPGIYGLANELLDSPDVAQPRERFAQALRPAPALEGLFAALAPSRILNGPYGTRCSTALVATDEGRWRLGERAFDDGGRELGTVHYAFTAAPGSDGVRAPGP